VSDPAATLSDRLTDAEFTRLEPLLPPPKGLGRARLRPIREILNAIFYVVRSGCAWRLLPHEFAPWQTAYHYFRLWRLDGTWEHLNTALREQLRASIGAILSRALASSIANPTGRPAPAAFVATTARNASMAASATSWSIAGARCCVRRCTRRIFKIAQAYPCSWRGADGQFPRVEHL